MISKIINHKAVKFLISGGVAAAVGLFVLYIFTDLLHLWYLLSSVVSFVLGIILNFILQKYWAFNENSGKTLDQAAYFIVLGLANLVVNTLLLYLLTEKAHLWYLYSQVVTTIFISIVNFIFYEKVIFLKKIPK